MKAEEKTAARRSRSLSKEPAKVIYLPKQVEAAAVSLRDAFVAACAKFECSLRKGDKDYLRALHVQAKEENPGYSPKVAKANGPSAAGLRAAVGSGKRLEPPP